MRPLTWALKEVDTLVLHRQSAYMLRKFRNSYNFTLY